MAEKTLDIDINSIFYQLHLAALENSKDPDIEIFNTGVNEELKTYTSSGEYFICASASDPASLTADLDKSDALRVIKDYVKFFCGEDTSKNLSEKMLMPIREGQKVSRRGGADVSEAMTYDYSLLTQLFEEDQAEDDGAQALLNEAKKKVVGYLLPYLAVIKKEKPKPANIGRKRLLNHFKRLGKWTLVTGIPTIASLPFSLLGKLVGQLPGVGLVSSRDGKTLVSTKPATDLAGKVATTAGKIVKKAGKAAVDAYDYVKGNIIIDLTNLESNISKTFDKDYPSNDVHPRVYKVRTLIQILRKQQKFSQKIKSKLDSAGEYCLGILVKSNDINYDYYNKKTIAIEVTKGIAEQNPTIFSNKITKDQVLKVAGYDVKSRKKTREIFFESRSSSDVSSEILGFLFESLRDDISSLCDQTAKLMFKCKDKKKLFDALENDTTYRDREFKTGSLVTKKDVADYFRRVRGNEDDWKDAVKVKYCNGIRTATSKHKERIQKLHDLIEKLASEVDKASRDADSNSMKPKFDSLGMTTDLYIVVHKGMKYPDDEDEKKSRK